MLLPNRNKQPISNIAQPRYNHPPIIAPLIHSANPHLHALGPTGRRALHSIFRSQHAEHDYALHAPFAEKLDSRLGCATSRDYRVEKDSDGGGRGVDTVRTRRLLGALVGEVIVVFDGLEGEAFAEKAKVIDWDWRGKEVIYSCELAKMLAIVSLK